MARSRPGEAAAGRTAGALGRKRSETQRRAEFYYFYSGKTSELVRQLALAGIAVIWIFKYEVAGSPKVPSELVLPLALIVAGLAADFLQYAIATSVWGIFQRRKELSGTSEEADFLAPKQFNWPGIFFFVVKVVCVAVAYFSLLRFVYSRIV